MSSGPRGTGIGVKLLIGAGALAYGVKEATYTGTAVDTWSQNQQNQVLLNGSVFVIVLQRLFVSACRRNNVPVSSERSVTRK